MICSFNDLTIYLVRIVLDLFCSLKYGKAVVLGLMVKHLNLIYTLQFSFTKLVYSKIPAHTPVFDKIYLNIYSNPASNIPFSVKTDFKPISQNSSNIYRVFLFRK